MLEKLRARVEVGGASGRGSASRSSSMPAHRKRAGSDGSEGGDSDDGMDWDELWASDSDGDVTEDAPAPKSTTLHVDVPALPLRILLQSSTHADAGAASSGGVKAGDSGDGSGSLEGVGTAVDDAAMEASPGTSLPAITTSLSARRAQLFHRCFPFSKVGLWWATGVCVWGGGCALSVDFSQWLLVGTSLGVG